jgi:pimeloyl-ACP methyl ester carboxylesterase
VAVNGVSLAFDDRGDGPAILLIHGYPLDRTIWRSQVEELRGWRRIAPDLRGMGESDAPGSDYSMATYAADLAALLDAVGVGPVVLCGLSMGGYVAFEMARTLPGRIQGLVLVSTRSQADSPDARRGRDQAAFLAREKGPGAIAESMLPRLLGPGSAQDAEVVSRVRTMMARTPVAGIVGALGAMRDRRDSSDLLASFGDLPVLIVAGESDQIIPLTEATRMHEAIPGSALRVVPNAGHLPPVEQPGYTTRIIQEFLDTLR